MECCDQLFCSVTFHRLPPTDLQRSKLFLQCILFRDTIVKEAAEISAPYGMCFFLNDCQLLYSDFCKAVCKINYYDLQLSSTTNGRRIRSNKDTTCRHTHAMCELTEQDYNPNTGRCCCCSVAGME